jgi:hypothetical protein
MANRESTSMNRSLAAVLALGLAAAAAAALSQTALAQAPGMMPGPAVCNNFLPLKDEAQKRGAAIQAASKSHDRKVMCAAVTRFAVAETLVVKFLEDNKTWCGVPDQALAASKASHEKTIQFRDQVCAEAPQPKAPTLSDALGTVPLDTGKNTKTGQGTLDTLTGNPLAK